MLTSQASKPSRIQPGDEYASFGSPRNAAKSPKKQKSSRKHKHKSATPLNDDGFGYGFDAGSGLSSTGELTNPFGSCVSDYDIEISYDALSALSDDKRVTITQFIEWINQYLQLNWDESRMKRAWAVLDQDKAKYITFKEFKSGLKSTNSDVILFYSNLMQRTDVHTIKGDKSDWEQVNGAGRIKRMREFTPRYLRQFSRKKNKKLLDVQKFLLKWRKFSIDFLHAEYWKPVEESNKNYGAIVGNLWQKICNMTGMLTAEYAKNGNEYDIITYELFVIIERVCKHQKYIAYLGYKHMCTTFIMNFNMYDVNDSNAQGKIAWCEGAMVGMIKYANRPNMSLSILNHISDVLLTKLGGKGGSSKEEKENSKDKDLASLKMPKVWNECCKRGFLRGLCIAVDCTESAKSIKDIKGKDGGVTLIKKLQEICLYIFTRAENSAFKDVIAEGYKLLSRIDIMNSQLHDKVLKQMQSDQRKTYKRNFGATRIVRFGGTGSNSQTPKYGAQQSGQSKIKPGYGAESPTNKGGYTQKYRIGQLGASVAMNKMKSVSTKSRIIDVADFNKLQSPFEFKLQREDIIAAFRYADVNQDNAISFTDFTQSLVKVGVVKDDDDAREMWLVLNPSNSSKGVNMDKFEKKLRAYPKILHNWLCRIISCNHLARQPFKTDPDAKSIKKILKDQRKLTWKERIDALHSIARRFARTNDSKKEFQNKFKSFLPRLLDHLKDPHSLVVRASCVALTKIMIYKNGSMTKYASKIMDALTLNFKKTDSMVLESSFGCFANLVRHVPDNKKFATLSHILKLVTLKNVSVRCMGWRIAAITFERILGLKKARPSSWWAIAENILKTGKKEKSKTVQSQAIRLLFIFQNSTKHYHYIEQYIRFFPVPDDMESIKNTVVAEIQTRMDEYADEAAAQADAMDVYSLISTEQDPQDETGEGNNEQKASSSVDGGGSLGRGRMFDFVDDIMGGKEVKDPLANRGLGKRLVLHRINRDTIREVYELYDIGSQVSNTRTLLASLKYLGINIGRGELTLLLSEMKTRVLDVGNNEFTQDKYAFFVKHCFATLDVAWKTYLSQKQDLLENMDDDVANIQNPKGQFDSKIVVLEQMCDEEKGSETGDLMKKCALLCDIFSLFVTPEVENDEILFEEMMEKMNPIILRELKNNSANSVIWTQEICIVICRIAQFHISRFAEYGSNYYDLFFQIIGYGSNIVSHCCSKTCLVIASMVQFLNVPTAKDMTVSLITGLSTAAANSNEKLQLIIYKCLLAEILVNVPLSENSQYYKMEVILEIWAIMCDTIYANMATDADSHVCINILGYMHSCQYLDLKSKDASLTDKYVSSEKWQEIESIKEDKTWTNIVTKHIEMNETAPFNNLALEHGWDNLHYYSADFTDRNLLLEQWYELEQKSNNPIGMAAVTQLIKALNHTQYKAKKSQTKPNDYDPKNVTSNLTQIIADSSQRHAAVTPTNNAQQSPLATTPQNENSKAKNNIHNATGGSAKMSSLRAQYLEQQRKQNQR